MFHELASMFLPHIPQPKGPSKNSLLRKVIGQETVYHYTHPKIRDIRKIMTSDTEGFSDVKVRAVIVKRVQLKSRNKY